MKYRQDRDGHHGGQGAEKPGEDETHDLGDVGAAGVDDLEHELLAGEKTVGHELARAERHRRSGLRIRHGYDLLTGCCGVAALAAPAEQVGGRGGGAERGVFAREGYICSETLGGLFCYGLVG
jgi:hypothetical protein